MSNPEESPGPAKPPWRLWKRRLIAGGVVVLALAGSWFVQEQLEHSRQARTLREMVASLDESDPGWRLEDLAAPPSLPENRNSARIVVAAGRLLPGGGLNSRVVAHLRQPQNELLDAKRLETLESDLRPALAALVEARKLAEMPEGRHRLTLAADPRLTRLADQLRTPEVAKLLNMDALLQAQKGDGRQALKSCRAILNAGRALGDEPFVTSQLTRFSCVGLACSVTERTLALSEPPAEELVELQKLLAREEAHPTLLVGLRGQRAIAHAVLTGVADETLKEWDESWSVRRLWWNWRGRSEARREHPRFLELLSQAIDNAHLPTQEQPAAELALSKEFEALLAGSHSQLRDLMPKRLLPNGARFKLAQVRCLQVLLALERRRQAKGDWPATLEELTPQWLPVVSLDPFDGKALRYRKLTDGIIVYSVGPDTKDDGGAIGPAKPPGGPKDFGYRLWAVQHRRQPPK
jgi:hypothetical protein